MGTVDRGRRGGGIALGDLGLYAMGLGATRVPWLRKRYVGDKSTWAREADRAPSAQCGANGPRGAGPAPGHMHGLRLRPRADRPFHGLGDPGP